MANFEESSYKSDNSLVESLREMELGGRDLAVAKTVKLLTFVAFPAAEEACKLCSYSIAYRQGGKLPFDLPLPPQPPDSECSFIRVTKTTGAACLLSL